MQYTCSKTGDEVSIYAARQGMRACNNNKTCVTPPYISFIMGYACYSCCMPSSPVLLHIYCTCFSALSSLCILQHFNVHTHWHWIEILPVWLIFCQHIVRDWSTPYYTSRNSGCLSKGSSIARKFIHKNKPYFQWTGINPTLTHISFNTYQMSM